MFKVILNLISVLAWFALTCVLCTLVVHAPYQYSTTRATYKIWPIVTKHNAFYMHLCNTPLLYVVHLGIHFSGEKSASVVRVHCIFLNKAEALSSNQRQKGSNNPLCAGGGGKDNRRGNERRLELCRCERCNLASWTCEWENKGRHHVIHSIRGEHM